MKTGSQAIVILLIVMTGHFPAGKAYGQFGQAPGSVDAGGGFTCSPAPCVLPPTQASEGGSVVTDPLIATNPVNQKELLLGSFDGNCYPSALGFHITRDGGSGWNRVLCMPFIDTKNFAYVPSFEPSVGYDHNGAAYAAGFYNDNEGESHGFRAVQKSTDGAHWSKPVVALRVQGQTFPFETSMAADTSPTSTRVNSLYVSGVMWAQSGRDNQVMVSHSTDGGATWKQVAIEAVQKYPEGDNLTRMAVGKYGAVYLAWLHCTSPCSTAKVMLSKSGDGGNTWSSPQRIAQVTMPTDWELPITFERVYNYPAIASDNSDGPYSGNLYVVMYNWTGAYLRVQMIRSTDGGDTWSQPMPLAPKSDTHDQFFPSISVSSTGKIGVNWLDRRNDPANIDYQAFAAISTDGGQSFGANWQLTKAFSNPKTNGTENNWMGDYTGNTWTGDTFIAAWMDSSNGVDMQEVVGGVRLK